MSGATKKRGIKPLFLILIIAILTLASYGWWKIQHDKNANEKNPTVISYVSVENLAQKIIEGDSLLIFDLRPRADFTVKHIPASVSLPYYEISARTAELTLLNNSQVILVCANSDCPELQDVLNGLELLDFQNVHVLEGGFAAYEQADLGLASEAQIVQDELVNLIKSIDVPNTTIDDLVALKDSDELLIIDTRTPYEFIAGFIPGAINIPLHTIAPAIQAGLIDQTKTIVVYDRVGNRSPIAAQALIQAGYENVSNLEGGIEAWKNQVGELLIPKGDGSDLKDLIPVLAPNT